LPLLWTCRVQGGSSPGTGRAGRLEASSWQAWCPCCAGTDTQGIEKLTDSLTAGACCCCGAPIGPAARGGSRAPGCCRCCCCGC
jgi:hypothetical protein